MGEAADRNAKAGRMNLNVGAKRKERFERACKAREVGMTAAIMSLMDEFIALTPGLDDKPPPLTKTPPAARRSRGSSPRGPDA